ncbi:hypothetical protein EYF80_006080 [Liparis tanakae]|uniref:Uncharacterized protein n=1 Tax=Liparis tanakae TaxID=230148 RepID=A0A4Z2J252_9TELE|nr:hypothetical protein EYF80_006080 [Liparis tanakae]
MLMTSQCDENDETRYCVVCQQQGVFHTCPDDVYASTYQRTDVLCLRRWLQVVSCRRSSDTTLVVHPD